MIDWLSRLVCPKDSDTRHQTKEGGPRVGIIPLILLGVLGVALILLGTGRLSREDSGRSGSPPPDDLVLSLNDEGSVGDYASDLERDLESTLSQMRGVGAVSVIVTLETDARRVYATVTSDDREQVEEKDSSGGTRTTTRTKLTEEPVITRSAGGGEQLVVVGSEPPRVKGVLVVATGARTPEMKLEIAQAVSSALGIALYRVAVVEREV